MGRLTLGLQTPLPRRGTDPRYLTNSWREARLSPATGTLRCNRIQMCRRVSTARAKPDDLRVFPITHPVGGASI